MMSCLFSFGQSTRTETRRPTGQGTTFRPKLEQLEEREVPSANPMGNPLDALLGSSPGLVPIQFNFVNPGQASSGQLQFTAHGQIGVNPINATGNITATPGTTAGTQILDLHLNPIHLDLLGLNVQTSAICLDITAQQGSGLLGNLLYNLGQSLDSSTGSSPPIRGAGGALNGPINNILFSLETATLLNGALDAATAASALSPTSDQGLPTGANDILHLSLGPVNLNLLGLNVALDNCANGPVTVDVYTETGPGDLLGNLLNNISNLLNPSGTVSGEQAVGNVVNTVLDLV